MKTVQIIFGLILVSLIGFIAKSALAVPEPTVIPFLIVIAILTFLLPLFAYQMKSDMAKMQKTMDELATDLKGIREAMETQKEPLNPTQQAIKKEVKKMQWDELGQAEKDAHIAKIQQSMEYTGTPTPPSSN